MEGADRAPEFLELTQIAKQLLGVQDPHFKYEDDEKDLVTITSNIELREAIAVSVKSGSILRLFLTGTLLQLHLFTLEFVLIIL
jgi:PB1 domain